MEYFLYPTVTLFLLVYLIPVIAEWRLFSKMEAAGWISLIPLVREWVLFRKVWSEKWFWIWFFCMSFGAWRLIRLQAASGSASLSVRNVAVLASSAIFVVLQFKLSRAFHHGIPFALGLIFLNPLFLLILGLGESRYRGNTKWQ